MHHLVTTDNSICVLYMQDFLGLAAKDFERIVYLGLAVIAVHVRS